jgi:hypothetical protein
VTSTTSGTPEQELGTRNSGTLIGERTTAT